MIRIASKKEGFRRCRVAHSAKPKDYADDFFTRAELKKLKAEPMLIVQVLPDMPKEPVPPEDPPDSGDKKAKK